MTAFALSAALLVAADAKFLTEVNAARDKATDYLKKQQNKDGTWESTVLTLVADMEGGQTALVVLALLEAGVPANDPAVVKAVNYLVKLEPKKTYVVSLITQVLARVDAKTHAKQIQANADWLIKNALGWRDGKDRLDGWSYPQNNLADNSNTHYAVMGLHAAARAGAKIDEKVWTQIRDYYTRNRQKGGFRNEGGWTYFNERGLPNVSMTGCGLLGLAIASKYDKKAKFPDADFEAGMKEYVKIWTLRSAKSTFYNLMVMAELGRTLGATEFKSGDASRRWYREGATQLMKWQTKDGNFASDSRSIDGYPVLATAFGLYFLGPPPKK